MRGFGGLPVLFLGLALAGCAGTLEKGDVAFSKGDWDEAVVQYQEALGSDLDAARRPQVQSRLDESRRKAGEAHLAASARLEASGDLEGAYREAELAYRHAPSDASTSRVQQARSRHAAKLLAKGKASFDAGDLDAAIRQIEEVLAIAPNPEARELLARARNTAEESTRSTYWVSVEAGTKAMAAHDWDVAVKHFEAAHRTGATEDSLRREAFTRAMLGAETASAAGDERLARSRFEEALLWGLDSDHVRARRDATEEARKKTYAAAVEAGTKAMAAHEWSVAVASFAAAHRAGTQDDSLRKEAFCKAMLEAEAASAAGQERLAQSRFAEALNWDIDADYVRTRRAATEETRKALFQRSVEAGTKAMAAHDWGTAVSQFNAAHRAGNSPDSLRREAFCKAMLEAERAAASGEEGMARARFEEALLSGFDSDYVRTRRDAAEETRKKVYASSVEVGTKAMEARDWATAVRQFAAAHRAGTSEDSARKEAFCKAMLEAETAAAAGDERMARSRFEEALLSGIDGDHVRARRDAAEEGRKSSYRAAVEAGTKAMAAREWGPAVTHFAAAHRAGTHEDSLRKEAFCKAMFEAEVAASAGEERMARSRFEEALLAGMDSGHVRARLQQLLPSDFVVTIHDGVLLPFKPGTQAAWDGDVGRKVPGAAELLGVLGALKAGDPVSFAKAGEAVAGVPVDVDLPDTYLLVTAGGQTQSSREWVRHDTCRPSWEFRIPCRGSPTDAVPMTIAVFDRDDVVDERIGSFEVPLAGLFEDPGEKEYFLVGEGGDLRAGGILVLRLSVRRQ